MIKIFISDVASAMDLDVVVNQQAIGKFKLIYPESGLHPSVIVKAMEGVYNMYKSGIKDIYIATHSELIVLRMMRMVKEGRLKIVDDVQLWQVCTTKDGTSYNHMLAISGKGELLETPKDGFFKNAFEEQFS